MPARSIEVTRIDYHRNGMSGEGFYVVHFHNPEQGQMMAVVFPPEPIQEGYRAGEPDWAIYERGGWDNCRIAVFKEDLLPDTTFGRNSWRGDNFAAAIYGAILEDGRKASADLGYSYDTGEKLEQA